MKNICLKCQKIVSKKDRIRSGKLCKKCKLDFEQNKKENERICHQCAFIGDKFFFGSQKCICKECDKKKSKKYRKNNKEKIIIKRKNKYLNNQEFYKTRSKEDYHKNKDRDKEKRRKRGNKYRKNNKEKILKYKENYNIKNKDIIKTKRRDFRQKNKEKIREQNKKYEAERKSKDPAFKLRKNVSRDIHRALKNNNGSKNGQSILKYLSYSPKELVAYLELLFESWMTWDNYGEYKIASWNDNDPSTWKWQIDHIIPQSDLLYDSMSHPNFKKAWALKNLRPYSAKQNLLDGVNRTRHKKKSK